MSGWVDYLCARKADRLVSRSFSLRLRAAAQCEPRHERSDGLVNWQADRCNLIREIQEYRAAGPSEKT